MGVTPAGPRSIDFSVAPASVAGRGSFDHSTSVPAGFEIGALVFSEAALAALPRAYQTILEQMSAPAERQMNLVVRREDAALFAQLSPQLTVTKPTLAQAAEWDHVFKDVCRSLKTLLPGGVVSAIGYC